VTQGDPDPEYSDGSVGRYVREQWSAPACAARLLEIYRALAGGDLRAHATA